MDKKYQGNVDLENIVRSQIKDYDELEKLLAQYLNEDHESDDDEPKKKKKKKGIHKDHYMEDEEPKKKKKKYKSDI